MGVTLSRDAAVPSVASPSSIPPCFSEWLWSHGAFPRAHADMGEDEEAGAAELSPGSRGRGHHRWQAPWQDHSSLTH